jgi:phosphatidylinositol alpha 1,6-mannosyltransferase
MRVMLVTESFYPAVDAATGTVRQVADRLVDEGHTVQVLAPGPGLATYRGARVERVRTRDRVGGQAQRAIDAFSPDLVAVHSPATLGRKALKHARRAGVPTLTAQLAPVPEAGLSWWRAKVADRSDRLLVSAAWVQDHLAGLDLGSHLWLPGVDPAMFGPQLRDPWLHDRWSLARSRGGRRLVVGYVGGLHRRHGVRALPEVARVPGVRPVVVGDGPQRDWLRQQMPQAQMTGTVTGGDLATALASLDVLVHPGTQETCAHVLREAAASGVPVVAPSRGAAAEVVVDGRTGVLYDPDEPGSLVRALGGLARAAASPELAAMGARARAHAVRRTWADATAELLADHLPAVLRTAGADAA